MRIAHDVRIATVYTSSRRFLVMHLIYRAFVTLTDNARTNSSLSDCNFASAIGGEGGPGIVAGHGT